ncbi:FMN-dependent dehydrogenase-domain-containing protein [Hypoxylon sp. NC1633]|nr:FMN-dependent dehydrogenase-domain-containing protein [Hypoxylon sp. NC1633]
MGADQAAGEEAPRMVSVAEISRHRSLDDLWLVVDGTVYDLTRFAHEHPGGAAPLLQHAGKDASAAYAEVHSPSLITTLPPSARIGVLDQATLTAEWAATPPSQPPRAQQSTAKPPLETLLNARDFAAAAQSSFSPKAWAFVSSAATDCLTRDRNAATYREIGLRPRVLRDVRDVDLRTRVLGCAVRAPIFCAPTSMGRIFHGQGEREIGRGCQRCGIPQCVSTSASFSLGEVVDAVEEEWGQGKEEGGGKAVPVFFQLYVDKDRRKSEKLLRVVQDRGVKAIFVTVDTPVIGKREADERVKSDESLSAPMSGVQAKNDKKGGSLGRLMGSFIDASLTWDDIAWLRKQVPGLPIVLKGIQTAMDAVKAMEFGVDAIYITNHGGRSLDTSPATILVLLELQKCCPQVFDRMEVYIDGGITRGTDIFKALCLGARAVGIGRGFLFALNYGKEGIEHFVNILTDELATTMQMCGVTSLDQVHPGLVHTGAIDHLVPGSEEHPYARWRPKLRGTSRL